MNTRSVALACVVGGVLVLSAACTSVPATVEVDTDDIRYELVEWARLAQNAHNMQPWRVVLDDDDPNALTVFVEATRLLPETDPPARQVTISVGAFLAVLEARAAQLGYDADITLFPRGEYDMSTIGELPVARVHLGRSEAPEPEFASAALPDAITSATIKYRYRPADLSGAVKERIERYSDDTVRFVVVVDPAEVAWFNDLSVEAFTIEMTNTQTLTESYEVTRVNGRQRRRTPYGIAYTGSFRRRGLWLVDAWSTLFPQSSEAYGRSGIALFEQAIREITHYVVIVSRDNSRTTQARVGMALQAAWMDLRANGHVVLANSQALQEYEAMAEPYRRIHDRWAPDGETVQMLLAVARPLNGRHAFAPRLSVESVISTGTTATR